ncbi:N-acetylglucosamine-6-phosphate deacetylase [Pseudorhodobacter ferrugineus]|uniref:N-acetylglucosamine-6-phosphate deacetylase n=1 Tax=Pseudorhodobacter ferrugineus TaxID=77008 RepID=UPI0003B5E4E4|nr:N-acetylglucosamine-6-phosphate deacetylase [Pseudorhodobacter ferrugineus]
MPQIFSGAQVFDGKRLLANQAVMVESGIITNIAPAGAAAPMFQGGILAPAFVDLQVNGGGGIMLDGTADAGRIAAICATHILMGCAGVLPTLITDTADATRRVIDAAIEAAQASVPGFLGLHLEGPHLDPRRKGAHDPDLIRMMSASDLTLLLDAAQKLPVLKVTLAPCSASLDQVRALVQAGVLVSLGHSDCSYDEAMAYIAVGAGCATHLFNAMAPMSGRNMGLVGAVLDTTLPAGIIADGIHVSPAALRIALAARPEGLFLISDCMAFAGTDLTEMVLGGRRIRREGGRLTLDDGTLAGADLRLDRALGVLVGQIGVNPEAALAMVTSTPAALIGMGDTLGHLAVGRRADMVYLAPDWRVEKNWWGGVAL